MHSQQISSPYSITKRDGITDFNIDTLARDPSIIVGYPYPPGDSFFYVDDTLDIRPGDLIMYSTEAENDPNLIKNSCAELHKARREQQKYEPGSQLHQVWQTEINRHQLEVMKFYQGRKKVKSQRQVASVDKARGLIVVTEPFKFGYKPKILGAVARVVGFAQETIDEVATDRMHKLGKKIYGSDDWQSEYLATGQLPAL